MRTQHTALWCVSLSNGETHQEEKGAYKTIPGELSPWQRLLHYMAEHNLEVTSICIYTEDGRTFHVPSRAKNPRFKAFDDAPKPVAYRMFRQMGMDMDMTGQKKGAEELYTVIEARYENGTALQVWVDNRDNRNSWTLVA